MTGNDIEFWRSVVARNKHVSGRFSEEESPEMANELYDLVKRADSALRKQPGFFFATLPVSGERLPVSGVGDGLFVFGVEHKETENRGEVFFDLFSLPVERVEGLSLEQITETLHTVSEDLSHRDDHIEPTVTVARHELRRETESLGGGYTGDSEQSLSDESDSFAHSDDEFQPAGAPSPADASDAPKPEEGTPSGSVPGSPGNQNGEDDVAPPDSVAGSGVQGPMTLDEVARFWERYRSDGPAVTDLSTLDGLVATVDGSLPKVGYVTGTEVNPREDGLVLPEGGAPGGFSCVYGDPLPVENEPDLSEWVDGDRVAWNDLPSYEEELRRLKEDQREAVMPDQRPSEAFYSSLQEYSTLGEALDAKLDGEHGNTKGLGDIWVDQAPTRFDAVFRADDAGDGGLMSGGLSGMIPGGGRGSGTERHTDLPETEGLDEQTRQAVVEAVEEEVRPELERVVEQNVEKWIERKLDEMVDEATEQMIHNVLVSADEVATSHAYKQASDERR